MPLLCYQELNFYQNLPARCVPPTWDVSGFASKDLRHSVLPELCHGLGWGGGFAKVQSCELNWAFTFNWDVNLPLRSHFRHELSLPATISCSFSCLLHPWEKKKTNCKHDLSEANLFFIMKDFSVFFSPKQAQGSFSWALQRWHLSSNNWMHCELVPQ